MEEKLDKFIDKGETRKMAPKLVDYLLYEPEDNGILWIKFRNSPVSKNNKRIMIKMSFV